MATKKELVEYIKTNFDKGYNEAQLREALKKAGHSKTIIDSAFKQLSKEKEAAQLEASVPKAPGAPKAAPAAATTSTTAGSEELSADTEKILSALAYPIGIIVPIILLAMAKEKNKFGKFHGFQALFWGITYVVIYILLEVILFPLVFMRSFWFAVSMSWLVWLVGTLLWLAYLGLSIMFAIKAYQGQVFKIPMIGNFVPAKVRADAGVV